MSLLNEMVGAGIQTHRGAAINGSIATGLTAAGTSSQANSLGLTATNNVIGTCGAATNGVRLPAGSQYDVIHIRNSGANACLVYPPSGGALNGGTANAADATSIAAAAYIRYVCTSANGLNWARC